MGSRSRRKNRPSSSQLNARIWVQVGGVGPGNPMQFLSEGDGQLRAGAFSQPIEGAETQWRPSDTERYKFQPLGRTSTTPDQSTITLTQDLTRDALNMLEQAIEDDLDLGVHVLFANGAPGDRNNWDSKSVLPYGEPTSLGLNDLQGESTDDVHVWTSDIQFDQYADRAIAVAWAAKIAATVTEPVAGVAFGKNRRTQYAVQNSDGVSAVPILFYTTDNWATVTSVNISALAGDGTEEPNDLARAGRFLIIPTEADSYVYFNEDDLSVPTEVASGFVASKTPNAVYAPSVAAIFMVGDGGYIYKLENPGDAVAVLDAGVTTTNDLLAVDGIGQTLVAVGASDTILVSNDYGVSWSTVTAPTSAASIKTVQVVDEGIWLIGADDGKLYYTTDAGQNWSEKGFPGSGSGSVDVLHFYKQNPAFGLLAHGSGSALTVYRTTDGGYSWEQSSLTNMPAGQAVNAFAMYDPNTMLAGGIGTGGTDGVLALAKGRRYDD